jgi:DNA-binding transcriptional LysR family regulator
LRYFVVLAEELHFGRAAARLGIQQPPLTRQVRQLEDLLGARLLDRTPRGAALTAAGLHFLDGARRILSELEKQVDGTRRLARAAAGRLRLGYTSSLSHQHVPAVVRGLREMGPEVEVVLVEGSAPVLEDAVTERQLDAAFVFLPVRNESLSMRGLHEEPLFLAMPANHPLALSREVGLESFAREPFIGCPRYRERGFQGQIERSCAAAGFHPRIVQEAPDKQTTLSLVEAGIGLAIIPGSARPLGPPGLVYRSLAPAVAPLRTAVVWRGKPTALIRKLVQVAVDVSGRLSRPRTRELAVALTR